MRKIRFSKKQVKLIQKLYEKEAASLNKIAEIMKCSAEVIKRIVLENSFNKPNIQYHPELTKELLYQMYITEEKSVDKISNETHIGRGIIKRALRRHGIPLRNKNYKKLPLNREILEELHIQQKKTEKEIAEMYDCSVSGISRLLRKLCVSNRKGCKRIQWSTDYDELYRLLIIENKTIKDVATHFGVSTSTLQKKLNEVGLSVAKEKSKTITETTLRELYFQQNMTQEQIAKHLKCGRSLIIELFKKYKIKKEETLSATEKNEIIKMYIEGEPPVVIGRTLGIPREVVARVVYRTGAPNLRSEENKALSKAKACEISLSYQRSQAEAEIEALYPTNFINVSSIISMELDLWYPDKKLAIEYNGDYWHSTRHKRNGKLHLRKLSLCQDKGIRIINIFERDWRNKDLRPKILTHLNRIFYPERFQMPEGDIKNVPKSLKTDFEEKYNLEGSCVSSNSIGMHKNGELVCVLSYNIKSKKCYIKRFTTNCAYLENYDKLFSYIKDKYKLPIILRYDNRYYDGTFLNENFTFYQRSLLDYFMFCIKQHSEKTKRLPITCVIPNAILSMTVAIQK